jgi:glycosyltransferase involved in cell wall biosynthesis
MDVSLLAPPEAALKNVQVSVIIPAFNEEKMIRKCLQSLAGLDFPRPSFEVLLVDNGSTDLTVEIARSFSTLFNLTILQKTEARISALRNFGVSKAKSDIFAFLDADCLAPAHWLKRAVERLRNEDVGVAGSHYLIPENSGWVARSWFGDLAREKQGNVSWVPAGDLFVTRRIFQGVGGFDESIQTNEDCEFCERVRAAGLRVVGDAGLGVVHLGTPQTLTGFYAKICWHSSDGLRVLIRDFPRTSNARPLLFGLWTLMSLAGVLLGAGVAVFQKRWDLLGTFLVALLLPPLLFSLKLVFRRKRPGDLFSLTLLHLAFGLARGQSLLRPSSWRGIWRHH